MEHFFEGIAPLRHCYIKPNEKSNKITKALMEHFFLGNIPIRHLLMQNLRLCLDGDLPSMK